MLGRRRDAVRRHRRIVSALVLGASILTCVALCAIAGWSATDRRLGHLTWWFIPVLLAAHVVAYGGYLLAHHQVFNPSDEIPVGWRRGAHVGVIGFGAWLIGGGFDVDRHALQRAGLDDGAASAAVMALGMLELALLAPAAWVCGILLLGTGISATVTLPWILGAPIGFVMALALLGSRIDGWAKRGSGRLRRTIHDARRGVAATLALVRRPRRGPAALAGVAVYWAADIAALAMALQFVAVELSVPRLVIAYATGYFLTRRTLPFAGVILTETMLVVSLIWVGVPLAPAAIAVLAYRLSDFVLTIAAALLSSSAVERTLSFIAE